MHEEAKWWSNYFNKIAESRWKQAWRRKGPCKSIPTHTLGKQNAYCYKNITPVQWSTMQSIGDESISTKKEVENTCGSIVSNQSVLRKNISLRTIFMQDANCAASVLITQESSRKRGQEYYGDYSLP